MLALQHAKPPEHLGDVRADERNDHHDVEYDH
jgi:hypothetical protein